MLSPPATSPSMFRTQIMRFAILAASATLALYGCTHTDAEKGLCPTAAVLAPTSAITIFRENAPADPSGELYTVWLRNVKTGCDFDKDDKATDSRIHLLFSAKRAPSAEEANYRVPYFVSVTHGGDQVMTKKLDFVDVHFAAGESTVSFQRDIENISIKFAKGDKVGQFQILTGFQL